MLGKMMPLPTTKKFEKIRNNITKNEYSCN